MTATGTGQPGGFERAGFPFLIPTAVMMLYALLALEPDFSRSVPLLTGVSGGLVGLVALGQYLMKKGVGDWSPGLILGVALIIRLLFVWSTPAFSDDICRYLFDGLTLLQGVNPYAAAPDSAGFLTRAYPEILPVPPLHGERRFRRLERLLFLLEK